MEPTVERLIEAAKKETRERIKADAARVSEPLRPLLKHIAERVFDASFNVDALMLETRSRERMRSRFSAEVGEPPWEYISWQRMATAKEILGKTTREELAVWRISILVGYPDHPNFGSRFQRIMGEQPSAIRVAELQGEEQPENNVEKEAETEKSQLFLALIEDLGFVETQLKHDGALEFFRHGLCTTSRRFFGELRARSRNRGQE